MPCSNQLTISVHSRQWGTPVAITISLTYVYMNLTALYGVCIVCISSYSVPPSSVLHTCPLQSRQESECINKTLSTLYLRYATVETTTRYTENKTLIGMHACSQLIVRKAIHVQGRYTWSGEVLGLSFEGKFVQLIKFSNRNGLQQWNGRPLWMRQN